MRFGKHDGAPQHIPAPRSMMGSRRLLTADNTQPAPPQIESDPYEVFKRSNAFKALRRINAINDKCEIINQYLRVEYVCTTDEFGPEQKGKKVFNVVFKLLAVNHNIKPTLEFLSSNGGTPRRSKRGNLDGTLWDWTVSHATEANYSANWKENRGYIHDTWGSADD